MEFFLYGAKPGMDETAYKAISRDNFEPVPGSRIARIRFVHDGDVFTATVGSHVDPIDHRSLKTDTAIVRAIIPGQPYYVYTTKAEEGGPAGRSRWENPFMVGDEYVQRIWTFAELD